MINFILSLLRAAVNDSSPISPPADVNWELLYQFFENQSLACTAWYGIMKLEEKDRPDKDILNKFQKSMLTVRGRESMQQLELENVMAHFEKEGFGLYDTRILLVFIHNILNSYLNSQVRLSNGEEAEIVLINKQVGSKPVLITSSGRTIDLSKEKDLKITEII